MSVVKTGRLVASNWENSRELVCSQDSQLEDNQMKSWPQHGNYCFGFLAKRFKLEKIHDTGTVKKCLFDHMA